MFKPSGGVPVKLDVDVATVDFPALLEELGKKQFTGYLELTIKGKGGIEEGSLLLEKGKCTASSYYYYKHKTNLVGQKAVERYANAVNAKHGTLDIFQLTDAKKQAPIEDAGATITLKETNLMKTGKFSPEYEAELTSESNPSKEDVAHKYKIGDAGQQNQDENELEKVMD